MRKWLIVPLAAIAILLAAGIAYASIPGPDGVIYGCRKNTDGSMRVIDSAASCASGWTALNWNQTGPAGPVGATGPQGPAGLSALEVVSTGPNQIELPAGQFAAVSLQCPTGKVPISGGYTLPDVDSHMLVAGSFPQFGTQPSPPTSWTFAVKNTDSVSHFYTAYVVCALVGV